MIFLGAWGAWGAWGALVMKVIDLPESPRLGTILISFGEDGFNIDFNGLSTEHVITLLEVAKMDLVKTLYDRWVE